MPHNIHKDTHEIRFGIDDHTVYPLFVSKQVADLAKADPVGAACGLLIRLKQENHGHSVNHAHSAGYSLETVDTIYVGDTTVSADEMREYIKTSPTVITVSAATPLDDEMRQQLQQTFKMIFNPAEVLRGVPMSYAPQSEDIMADNSPTLSAGFNRNRSSTVLFPPASYIISRTDGDEPGPTNG